MPKSVLGYIYGMDVPTLKLVLRPILSGETGDMYKGVSKTAI